MTTIFERYKSELEPLRLIANPNGAGQLLDFFIAKSEAFLRTELEALKKECVGGEEIIDQYDVFKIGKNQKRQEVLEAFERRGI